MGDDLEKYGGWRGAMFKINIASKGKIFLVQFILTSSKSSDQSSNIVILAQALELDLQMNAAVYLIKSLTGFEF